MKLLIVEDDRLLSNALARSLRDAYAVDQAFDGEEGLFYAAQDVYDLVVLDVMLPERDGFSVLEALRAQGVDTPVLMLTARSATADKLRGLRSGADDYLAKPFGVRELLARTRALLRRSQGLENAQPSNEVTASGITLNEDTHVAQGEKGPIDLTPREFELLSCLMHNAGKVVSREDLLHDAWGWEFITETKTVDTHIKRLRDKIEAAGYDPKLVETVRGYGYRFKK